MKVFGTTSEGGRVLCALMIVWCIVMIVPFHDMAHSSEVYFVMGLPIAVFFIYALRRFRSRKTTSSHASQNGGGLDAA